MRVLIGSIADRQVHIVSYLKETPRIHSCRGENLSLSWKHDGTSIWKQQSRVSLDDLKNEIAYEVLNILVEGKFTVLLIKQ